jgi:hypothetical protein
MAADSQFQSFASELWARLRRQPFGSLGKRELELAILDAATKAGLVQDTPDADGHTQLATLLGTAEILPDNRHLSFAVHNPALKIWLDRKLAANQSHHGDGIRSNIAKLSPATLLSLLAKTTTWQQVIDDVQTGTMAINVVRGVQAVYMLAVA